MCISNQLILVVNERFYEHITCALHVCRYHFQCVVHYEYDFFLRRLGGADRLTSSLTIWWRSLSCAAPTTSSPHLSTLQKMCCKAACTRWACVQSAITQGWIICHPDQWRSTLSGHLRADRHSSTLLSQVKVHLGTLQRTRTSYRTLGSVRPASSCLSCCTCACHTWIEVRIREGTDVSLSEIVLF